MNSNYLILVLISLHLFGSCNQPKAQTTKSTELIVNSINTFNETTSPFFESKYVKADDGKDLKFNDFVKNEIDKSKIKGNDFYLATALSKFSSIIATLSKEDAKKYGIDNNITELIKSEYQKYLFLSSSDSMSHSDYISIYLIAIQSISFHLKVKNIPVYKELDNLISFITVEINNNQNTLNESEAFKVNLLHCNFLYSIALDNYAKYLIIGVLEKDITDFPFNVLENQRKEIMPKADNFSQMTQKLRLLNNEEYSEILNKSSEIVAGYFSIINNSIRMIKKE